MKKSILIGSILAGLTGLAAAQSSVTVFGIVDMGVRQVHVNGHDIAQVAADGDNSTSQLGFKGVEDLGDGLKAGFWLESQISPNTGVASDTGSDGTAGRFFNRRATVSLTGDFGEIRLGRDKVATYTQLVDFDVFQASGIGAYMPLFSLFGSDAAATATAGTASAADTLKRADNTVSYFLPGNLDGIYGELQAAPGEGYNGKKFVSGRLGYADGPLNVSGAFTSTNVLIGGVLGHYQIGSLAASYDFGVAKITGAVNQTKFNSDRQSIYNLGANIPVGPGSILVSAAHAESNTAAQAIVGNMNLYAGGYQYHLSKRTDLYVMGAEIRNQGKANAVVASSTLALLPGNTSAAWNVGITHKF